MPCVFFFSVNILFPQHFVVRVIYFIGVPFGVFEFENLAILFSDLPQLLFHGSVVLTGIMWNELVDRAKQVRKKDKNITLSYLYMMSLFVVCIAPQPHPSHLVSCVLSWSYASRLASCVLRLASRFSLLAYRVSRIAS